MPGVIMENGNRSGSHTNHDRDQRQNGINGTGLAGERGQDKAKGKSEPQQNVTPTSPTIPNGLNGNSGSFQQQKRNDKSSHETAADRVNELPPEIGHITAGYLPLSLLLSRLAQKTHTGISNTVRELAQMPVPTSSSNGTSHISTVDDNSTDNVNKKLKLLKFAQDAHADWTKALVITDWSRKSEDISKVIDLRVHLSGQTRLYTNALDRLCEHKRGYLAARLPNPDLKTALEVLTTGKASWMPELGYIAPPPLTAKEILKSLENLNTLLSIRLNLHDYDNIPFHFKDYSIESGRATFKVHGEFEIDLTIADEDPESQFWFIDFRFTFQPSPSDFAPPLRIHIEHQVNEILMKESLRGCYRYLHELVLTHKITEFRKQGHELARGRWVDGIKVEQLNRTLSIQYWLDRYAKGPKSWILLGVHSGRPKHGRPDAKTTSRLSIRWFRDGVEVKDADVQFDTVNISTEDLLKNVIAQHVVHLLSSIYEKLRQKPLYADHENAISLVTSLDEPAQSELQVQLTHSLNATVKIEPITGRFVLSPAAPRVAEYEFRLNSQSQDPGADGHTYLESLRYATILDEIQNLGTSVGWIRVPNPGFRQDELKPVVPKDTVQVGWFRRAGWAKDWYLATTFGMSGETWWLIEAAHTSTGVKIASKLKISINAVSAVPTYAFLSTLNIFASGLVSQYVNLKALYTRRTLNLVRQASAPSKGVALPAIYVRLSDLLPSKNRSSRTGKPWAKDIIRLSFQGLELSREMQNPFIPPAAPPNGIQQLQSAGQLPAQEETAVLISEARMMVPLPKSLDNINEMLDRDIAFHATSGSFAFRLRSKIGESVIPILVERVIRIERLVEFVQVLQKHQSTLKCESVSLRKIKFRYGYTTNPQTTGTTMDSRSNTYTALVDFGTVEDVISLILEGGNPHLRIANELTKVLNDTEGLDGVTNLLHVTLPVLRAFDSIEAVWTSLETKGEAGIYVRAVEWYVIRYNFTIPVPEGSDVSTQPRRAMFEIRMRERRGMPWWYVRRSDVQDPPVDDLDRALNRVWNSNGVGWQGMRVSAVAQAHGVEELIGKIDAAAREFLANPQAFKAPVGEPLQAVVATPAPARASTAGQAQRQQGNQRLQQPTPSQSQSQGRHNAAKREIVEID